MFVGKIYKRCFDIAPYGSPYSGYEATPTDWTQIYPIEDLFIPKVTGATGKVAKFAEDGSIESTNYELNKTVPADAVFTDTTYEDATQSVHGLMSVSDKTKLDGITISDYLRKDDIVTLTAAEYEALVTKTAPYYFITDV